MQVCEEEQADQEDAKHDNESWAPGEGMGWNVQTCARLSQSLSWWSAMRDLRELEDFFTWVQKLCLFIG